MPGLDRYDRAPRVTKHDCVFVPLYGVNAAVHHGWPSRRKMNRNTDSSYSKRTWIDIADSIIPFVAVTYCRRSARMMSPTEPSVEHHSIGSTGRPIRVPYGFCDS